MSPTQKAAILPRQIAQRPSRNCLLAVSLSSLAVCALLAIDLSLNVLVPIDNARSSLFSWDVVVNATEPPRLPFVYDDAITLVPTWNRSMDIGAWRMRHCAVTRNAPCNNDGAMDAESEKYFIPQPTKEPLGGLGNQKLYFNIYGVFSRLLNRTLLVHPFCTHGFQVCIRADYIWDFAYFNGFSDTRALPLEEYDVTRHLTPDAFRFIVHAPAPSDSVIFPDLYNVSLEEMRQELFKPIREKYHEPFVHYGTFPIYWYQPLRERVRFAPVLRATAIEARRRGFTPTSSPRMMCFQVRWGDRLGEFWRNDKRASLNAFVALARENEITPLNETEAYFASEGLTPDLVDYLSTIFGKVHVAGTVFPAVLNNTLLSNYSPSAPRPLVNDVLAALEILLCSCADRFVGTDISTFSYVTVDFRANLKSLFPECETWIRETRGFTPSQERMPSHLVNVGRGVTVTVG